MRSEYSPCLVCREMGDVSVVIGRGAQGKEQMDIRADGYKSRWL